jgi:hypothetical protein
MPRFPLATHMQVVRHGIGVSTGFLAGKNAFDGTIEVFVCVCRHACRWAGGCGWRDFLGFASEPDSVGNVICLMGL